MTDQKNAARDDGARARLRTRLRDMRSSRGGAPPPRPSLETMMGSVHDPRLLETIVQMSKMPPEQLRGVARGAARGAVNDDDEAPPPSPGAASDAEEAPPPPHHLGAASDDEAPPPSALGHCPSAAPLSTPSSVTA